MVKSVRLACLMCAASVYPEPGSNSLVNIRASTKLRSAVLNFVKFFRYTMSIISTIFTKFALHNLLIETTLVFINFEFF